jgi:hypothetical protein
MSRPRKTPRLSRVPEFLKDRTSAADLEAAKTGKPTQENLQTLQKGMHEASQKVGSTRDRAGNATSLFEREYYEARAASATATWEGLALASNELARRLRASEIAQKPRPDWLNRRIAHYLAENPTLNEHQLLRLLRAEIKSSASNSVIAIHRDKDGVEKVVWVDENGREGSAKLSALKHRLSRCRLKFSRSNC